MSLSGTELQRLAREAAQALPGVSSGYPFTQHLLVYKVSGHVFLIVTEDPDEQIITVKAEPSHADALVQDHDSIQPGRYLDKHHWISMGSGESVTASLVDDLVQDSYDLVVERLRTRERDELRRASPDEGRGDDGRHE